MGGSFGTFAGLLARTNFRRLTRDSWIDSVVIGLRPLILNRFMHHLCLDLIRQFWGHCPSLSYSDHHTVHWFLMLLFYDLNNHYRTNILDKPRVFRVVFDVELCQKPSRCDPWRKSLGTKFISIERRSRYPFHSCGSTQCRILPDPRIHVPNMFRYLVKVRGSRYLV